METYVQERIFPCTVESDAECGSACEDEVQELGLVGTKIDAGEGFKSFDLVFELFEKGLSVTAAFIRVIGGGRFFLV